MAAVFLQKDNAWREFLNPLRGLSMDRIMQLVEQGERGALDQCGDTTGGGAKGQEGLQEVVNGG